MLAISRITGHPIPGVTMVPLISRVSAGQLLDPQSEVALDEAEWLPFQGLGAGEYFALSVEGDSMDRVSPPGSTIVVNRSERELVEGKAYVFLTREGATYKFWRGRPPRLEPASTNPSHQPLFLAEDDDALVLGRVVRSVLAL
jgi:SOS-response transcriptional repressor LexA